MARKWFMFIDKNGKVTASADAVFVDIEDVAALRSAICDRFKTSSLTGIAACDLVVYADQTTYELKQPLQASSQIERFGITMEDALIVQAPLRSKQDSRYFILPQAQEEVEKATFTIMGDDGDQSGFGIAVFFTSTLAVTCNHNLTELHTVGSVVSLAWKEEVVETTIVARNLQLNFAILKSSTSRPFIAPWNSSDSDTLEGLFNFALAFPLSSGKLAFARTTSTCFSPHLPYLIYSCWNYSGASGAALLVADGCLVYCQGYWQRQDKDQGL
ncbi:hypothetical protein P3T76_002748 [Phytophthora citrophthora]|uniref:CRN domain-containing protein-containing protein n=1 Tax=Phytophthora citrophthora TaxID=4793 RepID=A0AAD9GVH4_9STRA|nr:hypothetical protein P3T76_002748 [Phytophthora citrophthora]